MLPVLSPLGRAIGQLGDPVFLGVLLRCLAWSAACFVLLHIAAVWAVGHLLHWNGWLGWSAGFLASIGATVLASWLFLPLAAVIGMLYVDRIAAAVERRHYPALPPSRPAPMTQLVADGISLGLRVFALNLLALVLIVFLPGIGLLLGWLIAAYAIGRGLFMAVAMRRMPRPAADLAYRSARAAVLSHGGIMALAAYLPLLNLFIPVVGTAAMVHVLDLAVTRGR